MAKNIREFEEQAANGANETVKAFARDNLVMQHVHLGSAESIQKAVSKKTPITPVGPIP